MRRSYGLLIMFCLLDVGGSSQVPLSSRLMTRRSLSTLSSKPIPAQNLRTVHADNEERGLFDKISWYFKKPQINFNWTELWNNFAVNIEVLSTEIAHYNAKEPAYQTTVIKAMVDHFGKDKVKQQLKNILNKRESSLTDQIRAKECLAELFDIEWEGWVQAKVSPLKLFELLRREDPNEPVLLSQNTLHLVAYIQKLDFAKGVDEILFDVLRKAVGEDKLLRELENDSLNSVYTTLAPKLMDQFQKKWIKNKLSPSNLFDILKLGEKHNLAHAKTSKKMFTDYIEAYNNNYSRKKYINPIQVFREKLGDAALSEKLGYYRAVRTAKELREQYLLALQESERSVERVFQLLRFSTNKEPPRVDLNSLKLGIFRDYFKLLHDNLGDTKLVEFLTLKFDSKTEELAKELFRAMKANEFSVGKDDLNDLRLIQFRQWFDNDVPPSNIVTRIFNGNTDADIQQIVQDFKNFVDISTRVKRRKRTDPGPSTE